MQCRVRTKGAETKRCGVDAGQAGLRKPAGERHLLSGVTVLDDPGLAGERASRPNTNPGRRSAWPNRNRLLKPCASIQIGAPCQTTENGRRTHQAVIMFKRLKKIVFFHRTKSRQSTGPERNRPQRAIFGPAALEPVNRSPLKTAGNLRLTALPAGPESGIRK